MLLDACPCCLEHFVDFGQVVTTHHIFDRSQVPHHFLHICLSFFYTVNQLILKVVVELNLFIVNRPLILLSSLIFLSRNSNTCDESAAIIFVIGINVV